MKVLFEIVAQDVNAAAQLEKLNALLREQRKEAKKIGEGGAGYDELIWKIGQTKTEVDALKKKQRELAREFAATQVPTDSLAGLRIEYSRLTQQVNLFTKAQRESAEGQEVIRRAAGLNKQIRGVEESLGNFRSNVGNYRSAIEGVAGGFKAVSAAIAFIASGNKLVEITRQFDKLRAVLTTQFSGDKIAALDAFKDIQEVAAKSNFTLQDYTSAFIRLNARGIRPTQESLLRLSDIANANGKGINQLIEAILDAQTGQFERLQEFGIRARRAGDQVTFAFGDRLKRTVDLSAQGVNSFFDELSRLPGIIGGTAAVSETLDGTLSNLGDAFDRLIFAIGDRLPLSDFFQGITRIVDGLREFVTPAKAAENQTVLLQRAFNDEIDVLTRGNLSQKERAGVIQEINAKYKDYLPNLLTEKSSIDEIKKAQAEANKVFREKILFLALQEQLNDATERGKRAAIAATQAEKQRIAAQNALSRDNSDQGQFLEFQKQQIKTLETLREIGLQQGKEAEQEAKQTEEAFKGIAERLGTTVDELNKRFSPKKEGGVAGGLFNVNKEAKALPGTIEFLREKIEQLNEQIDRAGADKFPSLVLALRQTEGELSRLEGILERIKKGESIADILADLNRPLSVRIQPKIEDVQPVVDDDVLKELGAELSKAISISPDVLLGIPQGESPTEMELRAAETLYEVQQKIGDLRRTQAEEEKKRRDDQKRELQDGALQSAQTVASALLQIEANRLDQETNRQLAALDKEYEAKIEAAQGNTKLQEKLQKELAAKREAIEKEAARKRKDIAIKEAIIQGALNVVKLLSNPFAAIAAAVAAAAQIAVIQSTEFARGGFTGPGGKRDRTGRRVAGIVHENEYVAPTSQIQKYPKLFQWLESDRQARLRPYAAGGFTGPAPAIAFNPLPGASSSSVTVSFAPDQIEQFADTVAQRVASEVATQTKTAIAEGLDDASRRLERTGTLNANRTI